MAVAELVAAVCARERVTVPVAGASALAAMLSIAGMPTDRFLFLGFPPHKKGRIARLKAMAETNDGFEIARRDLEIRGAQGFEAGASEAVDRCVRRQPIRRSRLHHLDGIDRLLIFGR